MRSKKSRKDASVATPAAPAEVEPRPEGSPRDGEVCPVVGIGASAGGLEALTEFLGSLGHATGMAYVVVQHLAPNHESLLATILARNTEMPVTEATQGMKVESDHVYVIPPARDLTIGDGRLRLTQRAGEGHRQLPVDHFLRSLAEECGSKAIGVVFSGSASDGVLGLKAIKSAGGITFVQDEKSARYPEMPRSAAASGAADFILPPAAIARELARLRNHRYVAQLPRADSEPVPPQEGPYLEQILKLLKTVTGADFTHYKQSTVRRRILRRMALARLETLEEYLERLQADGAEVEALYDDVLINVTSFFRDPAVFKALQRRVFPGLLKRRIAEKRVRVWVPGCSTGEEVYSLAISFLEFVDGRALTFPVQFFGTDVSESIVARARVGRYPASIAADVPPAALRRWFVRTPDGYQVAKALRDVCVFAKHDLLKDPPFSRIDLVSCRNVLIYFGSILQKRAVGLFHYALNPDGFLILGASENIVAFTDLFTLVDKKHMIYTRRPVDGRHSFGTGEASGSALPAGAPDRTLAAARTAEIQREADRIVMSRYVPAGVVVDEEMDIIQFRGRTGPYLEPRSGSASLNLLKMAREGLALDLRSAFQRARREGTPVKRRGISLKVDDRLAQVAIEVIPYTSQQTRGRLYLVLFDPGPEQGKPAAAGRKEAAASKRGRKTAEAELAATKEYLQTIIEEQEATNEELMSANEEILSSNEELQSTNEELETAKEELQSSNEELSTVNDELQARNGELNDLNSDLKNLLATIHIPMVILDTDLRVRRASPLGEKLLNLIPADVGRRVTDLRPNVEIPHLEQLVKEVVQTVTPKELEVRDG